MCCGCGRALTFVPPPCAPKVRRIEHKGEVMCVALSQDGCLLITGQGKLIYLWDVETGAQTSFKKGHADIVRCLAVREERVLPSRLRPL